MQLPRPVCGWLGKASSDWARPSLWELCGRFPHGWHCWRRLAHSSGCSQPVQRCRKGEVARYQGEGVRVECLRKEENGKVALGEMGF